MTLAIWLGFITQAILVYIKISGPKAVKYLLCYLFPLAPVRGCSFALIRTTY